MTVSHSDIKPARSQVASCALIELPEAKALVMQHRAVVQVAFACRRTRKKDLGNFKCRADLQRQNRRSRRTSSKAPRRVWPATFPRLGEMLPETNFLAAETWGNSRAPADCAC